MSNEYDVVVIGAGAAGLVAANFLTTKEKLRVKLLEGSGLLGGRMYPREGVFR
jgi:phytoene dehydrogenase-like protein